ncbi:retinol dehydrogenase 11-like [Ischnura elegans]|uniref:retinol dehydrogenase 11-like n=1 Tax=Ischnura elegans TaxID=197161 RepID=UPI001ED89135|nr:retinol dehydrogenase 11-like [Ischnura elegans]
MEVVGMVSVVLIALSAASLWALILKVHCRVTTGICKSKRRLDGKTAIVTGANTGIGKETAKDLAWRGARVILACRDMRRAAMAKDDIINSTGNKQVIIQHLDLSSLESVRKFSHRILESEKRLDILVNNAAGSNLPNILSDDGIQIEMQTNHFGPFLLTILLLDLLKKTAPSRIVVVSSFVHKYAIFNVDTLHTTAQSSGIFRYCNAKLANILFVKELAKRLEGSGIIVNAAHPGIVRTEFCRRFPSVFKFFVELMISTLFKNAQEGAQTSIHVAVSEDVEGITGAYFVDCKEVQASKQARDMDLAKKLWDSSTKLVKLTDEELKVLKKMK